MRYVIAISCLVIIFVSSLLLLKIKQSQVIFKSKADTIVIRSGTDQDTSVYNPHIDSVNELYINTGKTQPAELVSYAETLIGIPYLYASSNPAAGFDCSGFITYVFNHFNIQVPRSSADFTNVPHEVSISEAKPADLILFTGTDSSSHTVGHMGIVVQHENGLLLFIHSTSGKADGVTITPLNDYYRSRFVKVVRVFPQNENS
ncbi:C40 family peptidase [Parafilimonas sp.]|uniref:C40 family peptidase n=1 Tax=Parafilimonas sp. TaxID=1969739 RepID=UPI0039E33527